MVVSMRLHSAASVFDGAPVFFGQTNDFPAIGDQSIAIRTVGAIDLFEPIQISQMISVIDKICRSLDTGNPTQGKANPLIDRDKDIHQQHR